MLRFAPAAIKATTASVLPNQVAIIKFKIIIKT
jgi:hypothetical protein